MASVVCEHTVRETHGARGVNAAANQAVIAVTPSLTALATGDGSTGALLGQWLALQGAFLANQSVFQKIGVNDLAAALLAFVQTLPARVAAAQTAAAPAGKAA